MFKSTHTSILDNEFSLFRQVVYIQHVNSQLKTILFPIEWDTPKKKYMVTMPNAKWQLRDHKASSTELWGSEIMFSGVSELWDDFEWSLWSRTNHQIIKSVCDLTSGLVTKPNEILVWEQKPVQRSLDYKTAGCFCFYFFSVKQQKLTLHMCIDMPNRQSVARKAERFMANYFQCLWDGKVYMYILFKK